MHSPAKKAAGAGWRAVVARLAPARFLRRTAASGSVAGALAAAMAGYRARAEGTTAYAPINAVAHCLWPDEAPRETRCSARYTLTGLAIHQGAAVFWGVVFELLAPRRPRERPAATLAAATATAATAYLVDYRVVPKRLTPGFENHLSGRSLACVYAAIAGGFALAALMRRGER